MKSKSKSIIALAFSVVLFLASVHPGFTQGTGFTYQGRLMENGSPANGNYDLTFALFDAATNGNQAGVTVTNAPTPANNGLFTAILDFGAGVFTGPERWLEIGVGTNGSNARVPLSPRQLLTATPYTITAANVTGPINGGSITDGTITSVQLASEAVTAANIASNSITSDQLAPGAAAGNLGVSTHDAFSASRASASASISLTWGSFTKMGYDTVEFDESGIYDNSTFRFTAPVSGTYIFNASSGVVSSGCGTATSNDIIISLFKNGVEWRRGIRTSDISSYSCIINVSVYGMGKLVAGDYIEVRIYQKNSASYTVATEQSAVSNQFSGYRLY